MTSVSAPSSADSAAGEAAHLRRDDRAPGQSPMVNRLEAKTHLSRLVAAIETGAEQEVMIARNRRPVARLTTLSSSLRPRHLGVAAASIRAPDSIDGSNPQIAALFEQG